MLTAETGGEATPSASVLARMPVLRILIFVGIPVAFIVVLAMGLSTKLGPPDVVGRPAPAFSLDVLGSNDAMTDEGLRGHPVVFNFWASWCLPCRDEAPVLERAWVKFKEQGVLVVGVNVQDVDAQATRFVEEFALTFPSVRDPDQKLWRDFGVKGLPETFFVDHRYLFFGSGSGSQVGSRGSIKVLGAIQAPVLEGRITQMLALMEGQPAP